MPFYKNLVKVPIFVIVFGTIIFAQSGFKNLQVLDKNISKDDLKATMNSFADYLDVKCSFCHIIDEYEKDEMKHKRVAREMIKLTQMIRNDGKKYFSKDHKDEDFTCYTCHNGNAEIKPYNPDDDDDWP
ncbi:MAG: c-type cytochrome [Candidatus Marinimicrobia bacterium]|mgnify:CR=1 FL=1|jgi:hypothetical protein|nr:c-type cytochrome [Candidatus Neomarinimicrobiota bacterium]MBT3502753.1 c-type cytochrome [Candidatus Neomarinimicrobiota bacterium]MBT3838937.1 c-type cytochrome [Candidatus Neomarinimicrobiota bacterium]MBT4000361.1 c-type cytochrome [Candidatus Neomarinimicrobiota bacterium]MBT4283433.1 c-type cytochrome [Candidatus Neomarinimicrobiota bacterium]